VYSIQDHRQDIPLSSSLISRGVLRYGRSPLLFTAFSLDGIPMKAVCAVDHTLLFTVMLSPVCSEDLMSFGVYGRLISRNPSPYRPFFQVVRRYTGIGSPYISFPPSISSRSLLDPSSLIYMVTIFFGLYVLAPPKGLVSRQTHLLFLTVL